MKMQKLAGIILATAMLVGCAGPQKSTDSNSKKVDNKQTAAGKTESKTGSSEKVKLRMMYWNKE